MALLPLWICVAASGSETHRMLLPRVNCVSQPFYSELVQTKKAYLGFRISNTVMAIWLMYG